MLCLSTRHLVSCHLRFEWKLWLPWLLLKVALMSAGVYKCVAYKFISTLKALQVL